MTTCVRFLEREADRINVSYDRLVQEFQGTECPVAHEIAISLQKRLHEQWRKHVSWAWDLGRTLPELAQAQEALRRDDKLRFLDTLAAKVKQGEKSETP